MTTTLTTVTPEIDRDRYGRPMVIPAAGGKKVPYTRCTTFVDCLEDKYNLQKWQQRMVITGLVSRPDLILSAAAHPDDKTRMNQIADDAIEAAKAHAAATVGTAIHALCHQLDAGADIGPVPGEYQRDLTAYTTATRNLTVLHSEQFVVQDTLLVGGTPDRIVEYQGDAFIADIKTGSIEYGGGKIAMQLAMYAHSKFYNPTTGHRAPLPDVNIDAGIVIHVPAGTGTATLHWVDIAAGWDAVQLAGQVRDWRKRKDLIRPFPDDGGMAAQIAAIADAGLTDPELMAASIALQIEDAQTVEGLVTIWEVNKHYWNTGHTVRAAERRTELATRA